MSVTLFEPSLRFLLEDQDGPVGLDLRLRSDNILEEVRTALTHIIPASADYDVVGYVLSNNDLGLSSVFGFQGGESDTFADYFMEKAEREFDVIWGQAIERGNHR